jgi:hypothetical protein
MAINYLVITHIMRGQERGEERRGEEKRREEKRREEKRWLCDYEESNVSLFLSLFVYTCMRWKFLVDK